MRTSTEQTIPLAGTWRFALDPYDRGLEQEWWLRRLGLEIDLPGTTDLAGYGGAQPRSWTRLNRRHAYTGAAWYQVDFEVGGTPRTAELYLERVMWVSRAWLNGRELGRRDSLCVPHRYDLGPALRPGRNTLTLCIDNRKPVHVGVFASSFSDESQTNWNGVVGEVSVRVSDGPVLSGCALRSRAGDGRVTVSGRVSGATAATVRVGIASVDGSRLFARGEGEAVETGDGDREFRITVAPSPDIPRWSPWEPRRILAWAEAGTGESAARCEWVTGLRRVEARGRGFQFDGRPVFLRGNVEAALHPLTGHPPMDVARWREIMACLREFGMNHLRFHCWCPPRACFQAADEAGIVLQPEAPFWVGQLDTHPDRAEYLAAEAHRILAEYGEHPSFALFSMGNELSPAHGEVLSRLVEEVRAADDRRLVTATTGHFIPADDRTGFADDFLASLQTRKGALRGHHRFMFTPPETATDYSPALEGLDLPMVSHEVGQWTVMPVPGAADDFTGPTRAGNLELFAERAAANGIADSAALLYQASMAWWLDLMKEEHEAQRRTPGIAGYQDLGLTDQMGWGTALVGCVDALWRPKPGVDAAKYCRANDDTVVLARMPKRVWHADEVFEAVIECAHHGPVDLDAPRAVWRIEDEAGVTAAQGVVEGAPGQVRPGGVVRIGTVHADGAVLATGLGQGRLGARRLVVSVECAAGRWENDWRIWVKRPAAGPVAPAAGVTVAAGWPAAREALRDGGRVVLFDRVAGGERVEHHLPTVFWSFGFNPGPHRSTGLAIEGDPPALEDFPHDGRADWHWWELCRQARATVLSSVPGIQPLVHSIDTPHRGEKCALLWEARTPGGGRLLVTTLDLDDPGRERPVADALRRCLLEYAAGPDFEPGTELTFDVLDRVLGEPAVESYRSAAPGPGGRRWLSPVGVQWHEANEPAASQLQDGALVAVEQEEAGAVADLATPAMRDGVAASWTGLGGGDYYAYMWTAHEAGVDIRLPTGFSGAVFLHLVDWRNWGVRLRTRWNGRDLGVLGDFGGDGVWLRFPVGEDAARNQSFRFEVLTGARALVTEARVVSS